jgi:hypothetical protein
VLKIIFSFVFSMFIIGCSSHFESTNQVNDSAFLQLEGNFLNTQLTLDNGTPIVLTKISIETFTLNGKEVTRFPISTGKHTITVSRSGTVIVNRVIYVSNSNTFEVVVP